MNYLIIWVADSGGDLGLMDGPSVVFGETPANALIDFFKERDDLDLDEEEAFEAEDNPESFLSNMGWDVREDSQGRPDTVFAYNEDGDFFLITPYIQHF